MTPPLPGMDGMLQSISSSRWSSTLSMHSMVTPQQRNRCCLGMAFVQLVLSPVWGVGVGGCWMHSASIRRGGVTMLPPRARVCGGVCVLILCAQCTWCLLWVFCVRARCHPLQLRLMCTVPTPRYHTPRCFLKHPTPLCPHHGHRHLHHLHGAPREPLSALGCHPIHPSHRATPQGTHAAKQALHVEWY